MIGEIPGFVQLIAQAKHAARETLAVPPEIEDAIIDYGETHPTEDFRKDFFPLFVQYFRELYATSSSEDHDPVDVKVTFLLTALLVEAGLQANIYGGEEKSNEVLAHFTEALRGHAFSENMLDTAMNLVGRKNPIWSIVLQALSS